MYIYVYTYIHAHTCTYIHTHIYTKCQQNVYVHMYLWCHWHSQYISWLKVGVFHLKGTLHTQEYRECEDTHTDTHTHTQRERERERERERGSQMGTSVVSIVKSGQATNYHFQLPCCYACVHIQCCHFNTYTPYVKHSTLNFHYLVRCVACVHSCGKRQCIGMLLKCIFTAGARERGGLSLAVLRDTEIWVLC